MLTIHQEKINVILKEHSDKKNYNSVSWTVKLNDNYDFYYYDLFSRYRSEKLSAYKKIFDYCHDNNIDLFQSFYDACFLNKNKVNIGRYPEFLDFINYCVQKKYCSDNIDFSKFINIYMKTTKSNFSGQFKLLDKLDLSENSLNIYLKLFKSAVSYLGNFDIDTQHKIKEKLDKFENQSFYSKNINKIQEFYPDLLDLSTPSIQEDEYLSKRFCFDFSNPVQSLQSKIENNLKYIYDSVFSSLSEKEIISDYYSFSEQGSFYLYIFSDNENSINKISKTVREFHKEISEFLKDNSQSQDYYLKLFESISLDIKLQQNKNESFPKNGKSKSLKI